MARAQQAEREAARPATTIETAINDLHQKAADGKQFAEALDKAGVTIARATAADVKALDALRQDQELTGIVADAAGIEQGRTQHFARLEEGDLAAVTRQGDVFRISAQRLEQGVEARLAEAGPIAPGVIEARATFEIEREAVGDVPAGNDRHPIGAPGRRDRSADRLAARRGTPGGELERDMRRTDQRTRGEIESLPSRASSRRSPA